MSVKSNSIFGRLAIQFFKSDSLFFISNLSAEAIHQTCRSLGYAAESRFGWP